MISGCAKAPVSHRKALLLKLGILLFFLVFLIGCVAIHLLLGFDYFCRFQRCPFCLDLEEASALSKSTFGQLLRIPLNYNPMFAGVLVNGGLIGMMIRNDCFIYPLGMLFCVASLFEKTNPLPSVLPSFVSSLVSIV